jgi:thiamine pyrophosphate-dependent acetolactate synthase large subunit-like protein
MAGNNNQAQHNQRKVMNRANLTKRLVGKLKSEEAVVGGIGWTNFELWGAGVRQQNFYMLGSMGLAFPIALGVALAQPNRRVIGLEGDGSLLMQVGALGTIASRGQKNLVMIVWDNGAYQITGGQPSTSATVVDLVGLARASGLEKAFWAEDEGHFDQLVDRALSEDGPFFIAAKIDSQKPAATTHRDPVQIRERFMRGLGVRKEPHAV